MQVSLQENPLTPEAAGKLSIMTLERHASVREVLPRGGARGAHRRFDTEGSLTGEGSNAGSETAPGDGEASEEEETERVVEVEYVDAGEISVSVLVPEVRAYFTKIQSRHKDPVAQPQEWFDLAVANRTIRKWTDGVQKEPPKGWVQDGWDGQTPESVKCEYMLILVFKGAMHELLAIEGLPETQKEELTRLLETIRLYKRADEHMERLADKVEPLVRAGFDTIRQKKVANATPASTLGGGSQTLRLHRPRMLTELSNNMSNKTIESTLDGYKTFADSDLSQHTLSKAVSKLAKKTRETESLSDKLTLAYKIARDRPLTDPLCYPSGGTEIEKEAWEAREARLWIEKVKPIYVEDVDWSLTIDTFNKGKKDSTESNLNFLTRLKGLWDTMVETCSQEKESVIPHAYKDEPGLVAHSITLIDKEMMAKIFEERIRDGKLNQMTTFKEFKDEILKYEQRSRAVNAMLGTAAKPPARPAQQPLANPPATGGRGLAGTGRGGRGRGAVRQIGGRGRGGGGGQEATPPAAQDGGHTPGQGADGLPRYVSEIMPHPVWKSNPYDKARMPPKCANGKFPCVLKYYGMACGRCDKNPATCMFKQEPREQDPTVLQETRDRDPHYKEFEEAQQNSGGGASGLTTPPGGSPPRRSERQRSARRVGEEDSKALKAQVEELASTVTTLTELLAKKSIRKVKSSPKTQASSSDGSGSEQESEEGSSDESVDPHKAKPLPPTSIGSRRSSTSGSSKKRSMKMMSFPAKKEDTRSHLRYHEDKLRITPEDWALTLEDLAERQDLMFDQHTFETADLELRSWGLHFECEPEALAKLADRRREKQHSQQSTVTGRRGMFYVAEQNACTPNWPLDDIVDEDGVGIHDLKEQWTPQLDEHVDYDAFQYLYERYPEMYEQLEHSDSPIEIYMEDHLLPNTSQWMVSRLIKELHLNRARRELRELEAVERHAQKATNVMAQLDWEQRNTDNFPFGPIAETKRLAIIMTQKEQCADRRLISELESQLSRDTRSIILEHEKRDFVESWRNYHNFALVMFELLNEQLLLLEDLEAERCLVLRLEALEAEDIVPTTEHYGIEQHFDLEWRRARTYLARTRLPSPDAGRQEDEALAARAAQAAEAPLWGLSRTRCRMYSRRKQGGPTDLGIEGIEPEDDRSTFIDDGDDEEEDDTQTSAAVAQRDVAGSTPAVAVAVQAPPDVAGPAPAVAVPMQAQPDVADPVECGERS